MDYIEALKNKQFIPNIVIKIRGETFAMRQPNSGLVVEEKNLGVVVALSVNPTSIDPFEASTTISNYSFRLLDKDFVITEMLKDNRSYFQGDLVEIWIGRYGTGADDAMDFAGYYKLPDTYVAKFSKQDSSYSFSTQERKDRLAGGAFNLTTKLSGSIFAGTDVISLQAIPVDWPSSGFAKIEDEFIGWTGIDDNNLTGCTRGEFNSIPVSHDADVDIFLVERVEANPIDILLQMLISGGGGGSYDVLQDGCAIDESLIDVEQFELVREELFPSRTFRFILGGIANVKDFIDDEICQPLGIRLRANNNSKIGLALLDRNTLDVDTSEIRDKDLVKQPSYDVDDTKITNRVRIYWDFDDATGKYRKISDFTDDDSIAEFGAKSWREYSFKGIRDDLGGANLVEAISFLILGRFAFPRPTIEISTHMSSSFLAMGDKVNLESSYIPNDDGELSFASTLEVIQKNINHNTGDCRFQLSFTSFTGVLQCFIAPSDTILIKTSQSIVTIGAGRGDNYRSTWKLRLYDLQTREYASAQVNEISSIAGDVVTFKDPWVVTIVPDRHQLCFADYDDVAEQQKKYCFIGVNFENFPDGRKNYQITYG